MDGKWVLEGLVKKRKTIRIHNNQRPEISSLSDSIFRHNFRDDRYCHYSFIIITVIDIAVTLLLSSPLSISSQ